MKRYYKELPRELYIFFRNYDGEGLPSFTKFAKVHGLTTEELASFRRYKRFDKAFRECLEIRRDLLMDKGLTKKFDGSVARFLLSDEGKESRANEGEQIKLTLKVVE